MATYLLAFLLFGGIAAGDLGVKVSADKLPPPATAEELRLEKAARDFRIQTYETFHKDRAEYDRRQAEGARVQKAWTDAGANDEELPKLIGWFDQATAGSRIASVGEMPAAPQFTVMPPKKAHESKLVDTTIPDSDKAAASKVDDLLHVKPAASTSVAPKSSTTATPPSKSTSISSLPKAFEAEISHTLQSLPGKPTPKAP